MEESMQLRMMSARHPALIALLIAFSHILALQVSELRAAGPTAPSAEPATPLAAALGVRFVDGSTSSVILERDGKEYVVDLATQTIRETSPTPQVARAESPESQQGAAASSAPPANSGASLFRQQCASCHGADGKGIAAQNTPDLTNFRARSGIPSQTIIDVVTNGKTGTAMQGFSGRLNATEIRDVSAFVQSLATPAQSNVYEPADDLVFSLPTGRRLAKGGLYINFTHRFAYDPAFSGSGLGNILFGLDGFSVSSFGLRYGITDKLSVNVFRSPSIINRPIEFMGAYNFLDEHDGHPINAALRVSDRWTGQFQTELHDQLRSHRFPKLLPGARSCMWCRLIPSTIAGLSASPEHSKIGRQNSRASTLSRLAQVWRGIFGRRLRWSRKSFQQS
jgi:mono/diheme cytochrome c family protein